MVIPLVFKMRHQKMRITKSEGNIWKISALLVVTVIFQLGDAIKWKNLEISIFMIKFSGT